MPNNPLEIENKNNSGAQPFLRWAGGKRWFIKELDRFLPENFNDYHEPFLGGGSVFFYLKKKGLIKKRAFLSDTNSELINAYQQIQKNVDDVIYILRKYKNTKNFYYTLRREMPPTEVENAARFIFLNRTSFNGIYRVNLKGEYNVPYGNKKYKTLFDYENLRAAGEALKDAMIFNGDFKIIKKKVSKNDLVFLDPPYTVAHSNNGFIKYNQKLFSLEDQKYLSEVLGYINKKGGFYLLTNAQHDNILKIYKRSNFKVLKRCSVVGGKSKSRKKIEEVIFFNTKIN